MILWVGWEFFCWSYQDMWLEGQLGWKSQYGFTPVHGGWWCLSSPPGWGSVRPTSLEGSIAQEGKWKVQGLSGLASEMADCPFCSIYWSEQVMGPVQIQGEWSQDPISRRKEWQNPIAQEPVLG